MTSIKPNMDCENCWLIVNEFDGDHACDECVADAKIPYLSKPDGTNKTEIARQIAEQRGWDIYQVKM